MYWRWNATLILVFVPGPNTLYIIARSIQQGRLAGIVSSLGVQVATLFHVTAATFGLSSLLMSSSVAFNVVKYAGAVYLIYLGVKTLVRREKIEYTQPNQKENFSRVFFQGVLVNLLNPKTALFFFAFLPQFIDSTRGFVAPQILVLSAILVGLGIVSDTTYALCAGGLRNVLRGNLNLLRTHRYFAGSIYIGLGALTALTGSKRQ